MGTPIERDRHEAGATLRRSEGYARSLASFVLFVGVATAIAGLVLVVNEATTEAGVVPVTLTQAPGIAVEADVTLPAGSFLLPRDEQVSLHAMGLSRPVAALTELDHLVDGLLTLIGAWLLNRALRDISAGRPFADRTANRIAGIGVVVAAAGVLPEMARTLATIVVFESTELGSVPGLGLEFQVDLALFVLAAILLVVAQVFRQGARMAADTEGLV